MRYALEITGVTVLVLVLSLILIDFLNRTTFAKKMSALVDLRVMTVGRTVRHEIQYGLERGHELVDLVDATHVRDIAGREYDGLMALTIRDAAGDELFSAVHAARGALADEARKSALDEVWSRMAGPGYHTIEASLHNAFGHQVGTLALDYLPSEATRAMHDTSTFLLRVLIITSVLSGVLALLSIIVLGRWDDAHLVERARAYSVCDARATKPVRRARRAT